MALPNGYPGAQPAYTAKYGAYTPDYKALALTDPIYTSWKTGSDAAIGRADVKRQSALRALVLQYGGLPAGAGVSDQFGDLDPATMAQAAANPESTQARLQQGYDAAQQQLQTSMAARGALHSGDLVQGLGQLNQGYQGNVADALNAFTGAFSGDLTGYGSDVTDALSGESDALTGATAAEQANPANQPTPGQTVTLRPDWYGNWGKPVYQGADGSLYSLGDDGSLQPFTDPNTGSGKSSFLPATAYGDFPQGDTPIYATG